MPGHPWGKAFVGATAGASADGISGAAASGAALVDGVSGVALVADTPGIAGASAFLQPVNSAPPASPNSAMIQIVFFICGFSIPITQIRVNF
jgi:hypothetical protein